MAKSSAHTMHSLGPLLPSAVPSFAHVPHRPTRHLDVTPFTRHGERARLVAEQWTEVWRSWDSLGTRGSRPVGCRWTTPRTPCGSFLCPQSVESVHPRIHRGLTWPDGPTTAPPVDTIGTTSRSPGCGRQKVPESVESGRNPARIRTDGAEGMTSERRRAATESGRGVPRRVPERRSGGCRAALPGAWGEAGTRVGRRPARVSEHLEGSRQAEGKRGGRAGSGGLGGHGEPGHGDARRDGESGGIGMPGMSGGKRKAPAGACPGGALAACEAESVSRS